MYKLQGVPAMMWPYHVSSPVYRWNATNFGKVLELKAEDREDATYLLAKLQPNKFAIAANRDRQKIFTSAEFEPNCLGTGKWYLSGLALTDVPASPWTTELMFSQQAHSSIYGQPEVFSLGAENNTEDSAMTQDQYDTLLNAVYNKGQQIDGIETRLNQYSQMINQMNAQQFAAQPQPAYAQPQQFAAQPQPTDALNNAQFQHLLTAISGINSGVAGMEQKFAQLMQDTTQTPSLNPAGGNQINIV